jgi:peptidoglycan/LPS O-acetylase OafA/YrhL
MTFQQRSTSDSSVLDFLRATAVSLVLVDHILEIGRFTAIRWYAQRLGWMGVILFFVHTSLVLMFSLERTRATGASLVKHFYLRRAFRIYPLAVVVILIIVSFHIPVASIQWQIEALPPAGIVENLLLVQNLFYTPGVLGPLWSLPLEVQMYVLLPFLFWMVGRGSRLGSAVALVLLFVALALVQPYVTNRANVLQFAPCFMGGVIAFCLMRRRAATWPFWTWTIALAGSMAGYLVLAARFPGVEPMALSWALGLVVGSVAPNLKDTQSQIIRRLSALVAKYSYGIYLTHMLAFRIAFVRIFPTHYAAGIVLGLALTVPMAFLAYHLVESPFMEFGSRLAARFLDSAGPSSPAAGGV